MGVIESIEEIIEVHRQKFATIYDNSSTNIKKLLANTKSESIRIHPIFMQSLLLFSSKKYVNIIQHNECHFYSLLYSGLLKTTKGAVSNVVVLILDEKNKEEIAQISLDDFIKIKTKDRCQNVNEIAKIFNPTNVKSTIKKIAFPSPKTVEDCRQIQKDWKR